MRDARQIEKDIQMLFQSEIGERVLGDLMESYVYCSSFDSDALKMAFNEGQKELVLQLRSIVQGEIND